MFLNLSFIIISQGAFSDVFSYLPLPHFKSTDRGYLFMYRMCICALYLERE